MKRIILLLTILCIGCKSDIDLSMERGIQFFEWNLLDKAILEFNQVVLMLPDDPRALTYEETEILAKAYHNLAIAHSELGRMKFAENSKNDVCLGEIFSPGALNRDYKTADIREKTNKKHWRAALGAPVTRCGVVRRLWWGTLASHCFRCSILFLLKASWMAWSQGMPECRAGGGRMFLFSLDFMAYRMIYDWRGYPTIRATIKKVSRPNINDRKTSSHPRS